jgi:hypothetical protein
MATSFDLRPDALPFEPAPLSGPVSTPGNDVVPVAHDVVYTWDVAPRRADLRALYEKSKGLQWNASNDVDWSIDVDPEKENVPDAFIPIFGTPMFDKLDKKRELPNLRRHAASYMLSNFLHGEQGALFATSQLVLAVPCADAKMYASTQVIDEARHVEAYDRYLREKFELVYPISPHLRQILDEILRESRWDMKYLGMQILVEGLALAAFGVITESAQEPLIRQIVKMIMQDEARHVAFGVLSLKGLYAELSERELKDREDFVLESSRLLRDRLLAQEVWENLGMPVKECLEAVDKSPTMKLFRSLLFSKIVPNTKRIGLWTPRIQEGFRELGVLHYEACEASA